MQKRKSHEVGFTLIEVMATLLLVSIIAALAGMWLVSVVNGYMVARTNMDTTQKAQFAMTRLIKEFKSISAVTAASANGITYTRADLELGSVAGQTVSKSGSELQLNGNILTDGLDAFTLSYCTDAASIDCSNNWTPATSRIIEITLTLTGPDNIQSTFIQRVAPRNL